MSGSSSSSFTDGPIDGVVLRPLARFEDRRGWLVELFRRDELPEKHFPAMAYVSQTEPGVARGPHEHRDQTDIFAFIGPGDFKLYLWDTRPDSPTRGRRQTLLVGESNRQLVVVPPGVVHAYRNVGDVPGLVFNAPNRLYAGWDKKEPVDEIRHEDRPQSPFVLD
jgi:dTDP-4-dehydrorhamnose 3,5-epimerase